MNKHVVNKMNILPSNYSNFQKCGRRGCFPLFVGYFGIVLGIIGLTAYLIFQIPSLREKIGKYFCPSFMIQYFLNK